MKQLVCKYLIKNNINNIRVIVAVSGGPDSIALLNILNSLKLDFSIDLEAAYLNHGIRSIEENISDYDLIYKQCELLKIKLHVKNLDHGAIESQARQHKLSVEAIARRERYSFFNSLYTDKYLIALGHNRDDQVETQIMRFFQGSSVEGLTGIKDYRDNIIRPLISVHKKDIYNYLSENNIEYNIDSTNLCNDYLRNRIRNELIPLVSSIFPGYDSSLGKVEEHLYQLNSLAEKAYQRLNWEKDENGHYVKYNDFIKLPILLKEKEIFKIFNNTYDGNVKDFRLPRRFLKSLDKSRYRNNETVLKGYGFVLKRVDCKLLWMKDDSLDLFFKMRIAKPGAYSNSNHIFTISNSSGEVYIEGLDYPFSIRSCISGYPEMQILKKKNVSLADLKKIIILEKNNEPYAIIYKKEILFKKSQTGCGIYFKNT